MRKDDEEGEGEGENKENKENTEANIEGGDTILEEKRPKAIEIDDFDSESDDEGFRDMNVKTGRNF